MQYRIQHGFLWTALHALGCLFGFFVLGYALYTWAGYGFSLGPNHHVHPDAPDPSLGARYFLLAGLTLAAYCAFALYNSVIRSDTGESHTDDDTKSGI